MNLSTIVPIAVIVMFSVFLFLLSRRVSSVEETLSDLVVQHNNAANKLNQMGHTEEPIETPSEPSTEKPSEPKQKKPKEPKA